MKKPHNLLLAIILISQAGFGQLPTEFIKKISYTEHVALQYEVVNDFGESQPLKGLDCLTLGELSMYHGYTRLFEIDEYIDLDGDLLSDKRILNDQGVRDDWMPAYSRIVIGKYQDQIFGEHDEVLYSFDKDTVYDADGSPEILLLSDYEAANYQHYVLDDSFFNQFKAEFRLIDNAVVTGSLSEGFLEVKLDSLFLYYDHQSKILTTSEYNWDLQFKKSEKVILYEPGYSGSGLFPMQEIYSEWFLTEKGCCIRKTKIVSRTGYSSIIHPDYEHLVALSHLNSGDYRSRVDKELYELSNIPGTDMYRLTSKKFSSETLTIMLYDMNGKFILKIQIEEGTNFKFQGVASGIYMVRVYNESNQLVHTNKVLNVNLAPQF